MTRFPPFVFSLLTCCGLMFLGCNQDQIPDMPPLSHPYYPTSLAAQDSTLSVIGSNHDGKYKAGTVHFITTDTLKFPASDIDSPPMQTLYVPSLSAGSLFIPSHQAFLLLSRTDRGSAQLLQEDASGWHCGNEVEGINCAQVNANVYLPAPNPFFSLYEPNSKIGFIAYQDANDKAPKLNDEGDEIRYLAEFQAFSIEGQTPKAALHLGQRFALSNIIEDANRLSLQEQLKKREEQEPDFSGSSNLSSDLPVRGVIRITSFSLLSLAGTEFIAVGTNAYSATLINGASSGFSRLVLIPLSILKNQPSTDSVVQLKKEDVTLVDLTQLTGFSELRAFAASAHANQAYLLMGQYQNSMVALLDFSGFTAGQSRYVPSSFHAALSCKLPMGMKNALLNNNQERLFVNCFGDNTVVSFDEGLNTIGMQQFFGRGPTGIAVINDTDGFAKHIYVSHFFDGSVGVYQPEPLLPIGRIFPKSPFYIQGGVQ